MRVVAGTSPDDPDQSTSRLAEILPSSLAPDGRAFCLRELTPEAAGDCDCLLLQLNLGEFDAWQEECIRRHCYGGGAIVAIGAPSNALPNWPTFAEEVLGGYCRPPHICKCLDILPAEAAWDHAILSGVELFRAHVVAGVQLAADATALLTESSGGGAVAWTHHYRGGLVFCTVLGHAADFHQPSFVRLIANAVVWACDEQ